MRCLSSEQDWNVIKNLVQPWECLCYRPHKFIKRYLCTEFHTKSNSLSHNKSLFQPLCSIVCPPWHCSKFIPNLSTTPSFIFRCGSRPHITDRNEPRHTLLFISVKRSWFSLSHNLAILTPTTANSHFRLPLQMLTDLTADPSRQKFSLPFGPYFFQIIYSVTYQRWGCL